MEACCCNLKSEQQGHSQGPVPSSSDPRTVLTYLTFLEKKIGYLRGIITSTPRQIVSAELSCIAVQLVSISNNSLAAKKASDYEDAAKSPPPPLHEVDSESSEHDERVPPYEVIQLEEEEILAPHVHTCKVCGKGFKRDANLRMHMRGHGEEYKTAAALAKPETRTTTTTSGCKVYSCPFVGCKRNREHRSFQPLKTAVCVKNHYRRSHCDKPHACRRCGVKRFSVLADLRTHEKHCGRDRWTCTCGTSFSRKDKLFAHVAAFHDDGSHAPALPPDDDHDHDSVVVDQQNNGSSDPHQVVVVDSEATFGRMADSMFDDFDYSSADVKGFTLGDGGRRLDDDDRRGFMSPMGGIDSSCDFDGLDLFGI